MKIYVPYGEADNDYELATIRHVDDFSILTFLLDSNQFNFGTI